MKLKQPLTGDYNPLSKTLRISGKNSLGKDAYVEFPVEDDNVFLGWIAAVLHEKQGTPGGGGKALMASTLSLGIHDQPNGQTVVSFTFGVGETMKLSFLAPVHTTAPERIASIQGHLEQALLEMGHSKPVSKQ